MKTTWKAAKSPKFANATLHDFKRLLGTVLPHEPGYFAPEIVRTTFMGGDIPASFDARTAFPKCAVSIYFFLLSLFSPILCAYFFPHLYHLYDTEHHWPRS